LYVCTISFDATNTILVNKDVYKHDLINTNYQLLLLFQMSWNCILCFVYGIIRHMAHFNGVHRENVKPFAFRILK